MQLHVPVAFPGIPMSALAMLAACAALTGVPSGARPAAAETAAVTGPPHGAGAHATAERAERGADQRIVISLDRRRLWLLAGGDTVFSAPIAIGQNTTFTYNGRTWNFRTPRGERRIVGKERNPIWIPPDWHYYGKAKARGLDAVHMERGERYDLSDGSYIEIRDDEVGRVNQFGNFWPFTPGMEIIFDGKIFIPPFGTAQRRIPNALGSHKLDMGDAYLIHGTNVYNEDSIGQAASRGCIRLSNADVARLYDLVPVGTPVFIF